MLSAPGDIETVFSRLDSEPDFQPTFSAEGERVNDWLDHSPELTGGWTGTTAALSESPNSNSRISQRQPRSRQGVQDDRIHPANSPPSPGVPSVRSPISKTSGSRGWTDIEYASTAIQGHLPNRTSVEGQQYDKRGVSMFERSLTSGRLTTLYRAGNISSPA
jgi:hypothetical protein